MDMIPKLSQGRLVDVYAPILGLGLELKDQSNLGPLDTLSATLERMVREAYDVGHKGNFSEYGLERAQFAVVAFVDEMISHSGWEHKQKWGANPLQLRILGTNQAGKEFYDRLEVDRRAFPLKVDVLEVYQACLALGFLGKFLTEEKDRLHALAQELAQDLQRREEGSNELSPHPYQSGKFLEDVKRFPIWVTIILVLSFLIAVWAWYAISMKKQWDQVEASLSSNDAVEQLIIHD